MKLLPLLSFAVLTGAAFAADLPAPLPEAGTFAPAGATLVAKSHPAWETVVSIEAKGLPLRAVLAAAFDGAKVSYAVDPGLDLTIYASVKNVTLREAFSILGRLAEFDVRAEGGVWYASRRKPKAQLPKTTPVVTKSAPLAGAIAAQAIASGTPASTTVLVDATPRKANVPMRVAPPEQEVARTLEPLSGASKPALSRRVTTRLSKSDLRIVISAFSTQTGVSISVDESVPRYKVDAYMKGCSLKYALDRICAAAGLKYESHGAAIRIVRAG